MRNDKIHTQSEDYVKRVHKTLSRRNKKRAL